jgi:hypothetical protein
MMGHVTAKHDVDAEVLPIELQQLGLPIGSFVALLSILFRVSSIERSHMLIITNRWSACH